MRGTAKLRHWQSLDRPCGPSIDPPLSSLHIVHFIHSHPTPVPYIWVTKSSTTNLLSCRVRKCHRSRRHSQCFVILGNEWVLAFVKWHPLLIKLPIFVTGLNCIGFGWVDQHTGTNTSLYVFIIFGFFHLRCEICFIWALPKSGEVHPWPNILDLSNLFHYFHMSGATCLPVLV